SSRRRHTRFSRDWSSDVCSSDLGFDACHARAQENASRLARWAGAKPGSESTFPVDGSAVEAGRKVDPDPGCSDDVRWYELSPREIGRASCRERVWMSVGAGADEN